jgi:hypothetical protein
MIPKTKTNLFHLAVSCETSFCMVMNIISCTYKVLFDCSFVFGLITTWADSLRLFVSSICNVFLTFYDVHGLSRWHWIPLPTKAHHILTYVSMCTWKNITPLPTCMDVSCQCSSGIHVKSCSKWSLTSWQYVVIIGWFAFLVCHLTELKRWSGGLLALWLDFRILCMMIFSLSNLVQSTSIRPCHGAHHEWIG